MAATWYVSYCPCSDVCNRGGRRLGSDPTMEAARQRVAHHLGASSYHLLSEEDANNLADTVVLEEELWVEPAAASQPAQHGKGHGKHDGNAGKGRGRPQHHRPEPYSLNEVVASTLAHMQQQQQTIHGPDVPQVRIAPVHERIHTIMARAEAAARTSARMARAAAIAFEEEAANLRACLDMLEQ